MIPEPEFHFPCILVGMSIWLSYFVASFVCQTGYYPVHNTDAQGMQSIECKQSGAPLPHLTNGILTLVITGRMILGLLMVD